MEGFDTEMLDILRDVAVVRPSDGSTPININTAQPDVLLALSNNITQADVDIILEERQSSPYASVQALVTQPHFSAWAPALNVARLSVASDAFIVHSQARFGRVLWGEEMMLGRVNQKLSVIYRQRMGWNN